MQKLNFKKIIIIFLVVIVLFILLVNIIKKDKTMAYSSLCNENLLYGTYSFNKDTNKYIIDNVTYCKKYDISKYKEINATLFKKENNSINEIAYYEYNENTAILLDKFLIDKTFTSNLDNNKDTIYLEVKVVGLDNKLDLINIPLFIEN